MVNTIVDLSQKLRLEGLPVSIRSTNSAIDTYDFFKNQDRQTLKIALRSVYVKNRYDISKFNKIFEEFFKEEKKEEKIIKENKRKFSYKNLKSNKYIIKKQNKRKTFKKEMDNNKLLKELSGRPPLTEYETFEKEGELLNKDLTKLNRFDPRMLEICQRLGRKIANKRSRRKISSNKNKIDIRKTMRANLKYGGVPINLIKAKPRHHKNEHIFLNDISGSCEWISSWFFMLMFSAQMAFKKSRTFEFDNKVIETTNALKEEYLLLAFSKVRDKRLKNAMVHGTSNMYTAFKSFKKMVNLNNKSYLIILSDCRDWAGPKIHGIPASVKLVEQMVNDSKKVIILNPEDRNKWDVVDSCVSLYKDVGAQVYEVNTLNQLANFVESM